MTGRRDSLVRDSLVAARTAAATSPALTTAYVTLSMLGGLAPVAVAWLTKKLFDALADGANGALSAALWLAVGGVVLATVQPCARLVRAELARRVALSSTRTLYRAVEGFVGLSRFEDPAFLSRLRLATRSGEAAPMRALDAALGVSRGALQISGFLGVLVAANAPVALVAVLASVPLLVAELRLGRRSATAELQMVGTHRWEIFYGDLLTDPTAAKEVRLFNIGEFLLARLLGARRRNDATQRGLDVRQGVAEMVFGGFAAGAAGAALLWVTWQVLRGHATIGEVALFVAALAGVQAGVAALITELSHLHRQLLLFRHYQHIRQAPSDLCVPTAPVRVGPLRVGIEVRDVWFRYSDGDPWVLRGLTVTIRAGETTAFVGVNGSGKSTLVKLLCRFYDPTRGVIRWDGVDIREIDPVELRSRITAVFQDYMHYDLSVAENIAVGDVPAMGDTARIVASAQLACVHDKIEQLPDGYDTLLSRVLMRGDDGVESDANAQLSEGQWQRIAIARAIFRRERDLLILDEPNAGLDAEAEHQVHSMTRRLGAGQTSLLISHRLNAVRSADTIAVIEDGTVTETGTHQDLMSRPDTYARLFRLQASGYADGHDEVVVG
jgi:ATP-binding cassette subfamily B protein